MLKIAKWMDLNILGLPPFLILKMRALPQFGLMERSLTWYCQLKFVSIIALTIIQKIFETNSSSHVKLRTRGKVYFLFFKSFC